MSKSLPPLYICQSFVVFQESRNMIEAAEKLGISQPLLSLHLQELQTHFEEELFHFLGRKKMPTDFGLELCNRLKKGFKSLETELDSLKQHSKNPKSHVLKIGARAELLARLPAFAQFEGQIHYLPMSGTEVIDALRTREIDIGITQYEIDSLDFIEKAYFKDQFFLLAPSKWMDSGPLGIQLSKLKTKPYFSFGSLDPKDKILQKLNLNLQIQPTRTLANWVKIVEFVELGLGWSLVPSFFLNEKKNCTKIEIPDSLLAGTQFYIAYSKDRAKHDWFKKVTQEISNTLSFDPKKGKF